MTFINYKKNTLHIEGVALPLVAEKFGTPAYVYSAGAIRANYGAYRAALSKVMPESDFTICYAVKANSNQAVLRLLGNLGAGADIVSGGELMRALKAAIPAGKIVYSGVGKSAAELRDAVKRNILQINVESEHELDLISKFAVELGVTARIAIRVNPDVDAKTHKKITTGKKDNKFGIDMSRAPALYKKAKSLPGIKAQGVAVHIGSQLTSLAPYKEAYKRLAAFITDLRKKGHDIRVADLGGGIGIRYDDEKTINLDAYAKAVKDIIAPLGVHVVIEPGRSIVGNAGILLTSVLNIKKSPHKTFVILDAAMNDLIRPAMYDAHHDVLPVVQSRRKKTRVDIVGPVCETGDTFHNEIDMTPLAAGDLAAIMSAGAYGAVMSSTYNTRPLVPEVLVENKTFALVRKVRTAEEMIAADIVPDWVK